MLGPEMDPSWGRFALASFTVIGLLSLLAIALKALANRGILAPRSTDRRLRFVAALPLDAKRRLVITRCDDKEYLLLLGANTDLLLSTMETLPDNKNEDENDA
ncbi:MAG: flagellar biosynthetic protein FliO [Bdellovibrionales bacterium]